MKNFSTNQVSSDSPQILLLVDKLLSLNPGQDIFVSTFDIERRKISSKYLQNILFATPELKGRVRIKSVKDGNKQYLGYKAIRIA